MKAGNRLFVTARGRWIICTALDVEVHEAALRADSARARQLVDLWCNDADTWPTMLMLFERITGTQLRAPTLGDADLVVKPTLRRAFREGQLVALDLSRTPTWQRTEEGVHAKKTLVERPADPPAPVRGTPPSKKTHTFAVRWLDEVGQSIGGIALELDHGGDVEPKTTDGQGVARIEESTSPIATVRITRWKPPVVSTGTTAGSIARWSATMTTWSE